MLHCTFSMFKCLDSDSNKKKENKLLSLKMYMQ